MTTPIASLLVAHLDLKGVQHSPEFYKTFLRRLKEFGYDAVLVEYEDVFPFRDACFSQHPEERWSRDFLEAFQNDAAALGVEIIPLQQCLGHLEYAFRWERYRGMAIPVGVPSDVHLGLPVAREWLKGLLEEVLEAHPRSRFIHLGMDEARSLRRYAQESGIAVLDLFLGYLDELCTLCERYGKTPLIWSDMLEDDIAPENIDRILAFRDRVALVPWNYTPLKKPETVVRFSGMRCSRDWQMGRISGTEDDEPPRDGLLHFEDWPEEIAALAEEFRVSPWQMEPLFQAGVWRKLGFSVWGGAAASFTQDRSILPYYHWRRENITRWQECAFRFGLEGVIATQWARSNSCSAPNLLMDVVWPVLARAGKQHHVLWKKDGPAPMEIFPELAEATREALFERIGRCRESWNIEESLLVEMKELEPLIHEHRFEWKSVTLLLALQREHKRLAEAQSLADCYLGFGRLMRTGWHPIQEDLWAIREALQALERELRAHLPARYKGAALREWFAKVFTFPQKHLDSLLRAIEESIAAHERNPAFRLKKDDTQENRD